MTRIIRSPRCRLSRQSSWPQKIPIVRATGFVALWQHGRPPRLRAHTELQSCLIQCQQPVYRKAESCKSMKILQRYCYQHNWWQRVLVLNYSVTVTADKLVFFKLSGTWTWHWHNHALTKILLHKLPFCIPKSVRTRSTIFSSPLGARRRCPPWGFEK